ncbi:MAG: hypothetical protein RID42_03180 [Alphaproteobacteria bacterium]
MDNDSLRKRNWELPVFLIALAAIAACCGLLLLIVAAGAGFSMPVFGWLGISTWISLAVVAVTIVGLLWRRRVLRVAEVGR